MQPTYNPIDQHIGFVIGTKLFKMFIDLEGESKFFPETECRSEYVFRDNHFDDMERFFKGIANNDYHVYRFMKIVYIGHLKEWENLKTFPKMMDYYNTMKNDMLDIVEHYKALDGYMYEEVMFKAIYNYSGVPEQKQERKTIKAKRRD